MTTTQYLARGDLVRLIDLFPGRDNPRRAIITDIERRFTHTDQGKIGNLIHCVDEAGEALGPFDEAFVGAIISRGHLGPSKTNIFAAERARRLRLARKYPDSWQDHHHGAWIKRLGRNTLEGKLDELAVFVLASSPRKLERPLDEFKLHQLFKRDRPGYLTGETRYAPQVRVHEKPFRVWVLRNIDRITMTVREQTRQETMDWRTDMVDFAAAHDPYLDDLANAW